LSVEDLDDDIVDMILEFEDKVEGVKASRSPSGGGFGFLTVPTGGEKNGGRGGMWS